MTDPTKALVTMSPSAMAAASTIAERTLADRTARADALVPLKPGAQVPTILTPTWDRRRVRAALVFLVDQSTWMAQPFGSEPSMRFADAAASVINRSIAGVIVRCSRDSGVRDYFEVAAIGYGDGIRSLLQGSLGLRPISEIADGPIRIDERQMKVPDGVGGVMEMAVKFPVWVEPRAEGTSSMCAALDAAYELLDGWQPGTWNDKGPAVFNLTAGVADDGDPRPIADRVRGLRSEHGSVLLANSFLSPFGGAAVAWPSSAAGIADPRAATLFEMSSRLPRWWRETAKSHGIETTSGARAFTFNSANGFEHPLASLSDPMPPFWPPFWDEPAD